MKIAVCQLEIKLEKKEINIERAIAFIKEAAENNAELILFPEMSFTGFSMRTAVTGEEKRETVEAMKQIAKDNNIAIGFGWVKNLADSENHYTIVNNEGCEIADYAKIHPFSFAKEDQYFKAGEKPCAFALNEINFGLAICYDLRFPELFQYLSKTAGVLLIPANWPARRKEHWMTLLKARAIENQCYVIGINCVGKQGFAMYEGDSLVLNPNGDIINHLENEAMVYVDIENDVDEYRNKFPTKDDRRPDLYKNFY